MKTIKINNTIIPIPTWNTYSKKQLIKLAELALMDLYVNEFCIRALLIITGIQIINKKPVIINEEECFWVKFRRKKILIGEDDLSAIISKLKEHFFILKEIEGTQVFELNPVIYKPVINCFRIGKTLFYSPSQALSNIIFEEWIYTETYFSRFQKDKDEDHLNALIAVLFRPKPGIFKRRSILYTGDKRREFNIFQCKRTIKQISKLPEEYKKAIIWYYTGSRKYIFGKFSYLFRSSGSGSIVEDTFENMMELTAQISGGAVNHEKVRRTLLYDILTELNEKVKHAKNNKHAV